MCVVVAIGSKLSLPGKAELQKLGRAVLVGRFVVVTSGVVVGGVSNGSVFSCSVACVSDTIASRSCGGSDVGNSMPG